MATMLYFYFKFFYLCLGIFNIYIILCECFFVDDLNFENADVWYIHIYVI